LNLAREHAELVITPSFFTRDELLLEGFAADQLRMVPLGCDPPRSESPTASVDTLVALTGVRSPFVLSSGPSNPARTSASRSTR